MPGARRREAPFLPLSPYGIAKKCGEEYLAGWNRIHGTQHVSLRFANVYGPRQDAGLEGGVVAIFLERIARGDETIIFGDGGAAPRLRLRRRHRRRAARHRRPQRRPVQRRHRPGRRRSRELHDACARVAGVDAEPRLEAARLGDVRRSVLDSRLIERELGWSAETSLDDGLARTWAWMQEARRAVAKRVALWTRHFDAPDALIRPWRTATLVASLVAAVELVLLVVAAVLLLAKPLSHAMQRQARGRGASHRRRRSPRSPVTPKQVAAAEAEADPRRRRASSS